MKPELDDLLKLQIAAADRPRRGRRSSGGSRAFDGRLTTALQTKSRGMAFTESRPYQIGDDSKLIDWRATARQGKTYSKQFEIERDRRVWLIVDQRESMRFGSVGTFKSVLAARAAAWLAWSANAAGDRVGGVVLNQERTTGCMPRQGRRGVTDLLALLCGGVDSDCFNMAESNLPSVIEFLLVSAGPGNTFVVLSDFSDLDHAGVAEQTASAMIGLASKGSVSVCHISDPLEACPPPPGDYPVLTQAGVTRWLDLTDPVVRHAWSVPYVQRSETLSVLLASVGLTPIELSTGQDVESALIAWMDQA